MFIIKNSHFEDIDEIFRLYEIATDYQKFKSECHWPEFEKSLIETEIAELRQWKIVEDNKIMCIWATTFSDPQIWGDKNDDPAIYIHRIAINPEFRGHNFVQKIVDWAKKYAIENDKKFIRMDTVGNNIGLINYYTKCGFTFLGLSKLTNTEGLPSHYHKAEVSLFEIMMDDS